ncbi:diacylglycerol kinase [Neorhizobium lilium]|uniref:Diacylglycerol kinase n=2 Tax=Neorhizobium lilium TaxID=2503024 RepID=A0A3S3RQB7_9HYPH|nr:diacylglycerol kinase [Neorhizobium lilium]
MNSVLPLEEKRVTVETVPTVHAVAEEAPAKVVGIRHLFAAFGYSLAGAMRLLQETAFRHELLLALVVLGSFAYAGASMAACMVQIVLILALFSFEAINTAIEEIVDRVSPEWSKTGRHAKDLGSFAVLCMLAANALHALFVLFPLLHG